MYTAGHNQAQPEPVCDLQGDVSTLFWADAPQPQQEVFAEPAHRVVADHKSRGRSIDRGIGDRGDLLRRGVRNRVTARAVDPQHYLADVLRAIADHPARRIDELLTRNWQPIGVPRAAA